MILFVLIFVVLAVALPAIGDVWSHGEDNVFTRSRREVVSLAKPYLEDLGAAVSVARQRLAWQAFLALQVRLVKVLLDLVLTFIRRIGGS
jgi:hypothetical protein